MSAFKHSDDPHANLKRVYAGPPPEEAQATMILVHGRGGSARGMLRLAGDIAHQYVAFVSVEANDRIWYPRSFLAPIEANEPHLSSALQSIDKVVEEVHGRGPAYETIMLLGFSQGACLSLEYAARFPRKYGGVVAFSGGLIGPEDHPFDYEGSLDGTPVFLGCSDHDPHIPLERVNQSTEILRELGADVTERIYPDMGHTVNDDEIEFVRDLLRVRT